MLFPTRILFQVDPHKRPLTHAEFLTLMGTVDLHTAILHDTVINAERVTFPAWFERLSKHRQEQIIHAFGEGIRHAHVVANREAPTRTSA
jgi:hypothetical protein